MRPHQWTKNLACFAGLFFGAKALDVIAVLQSVIGFTAFCFASSFVYVINDITDHEKDRAHPIKKQRPLPSGKIGIHGALCTASLCLFAALIASSAANNSVMSLTAVYILLNIGYSLSLRNVVVLDVMLISFGFIMRILVGTESIHVIASAWILLCAFFLSLFLGFGKRRAELSRWSDISTQSRTLLSEYSVAMLDRFCNIFATLSIASYALFTVTSRPDRSLLITCPPVVFGLLRYLYLIEIRDAGESPDIVLLRDKPLQAAIIVWGGLSFLVLYMGLRLELL